MARSPFRTCAALAAISVLGSSSSRAAAEEAQPAPAHGPSAPATAFPSHSFQLAPHRPKAQLSFHAGLLQPILLHGLNAAVDFRFDRFILTYSHGEGLDLTDLETEAEKKRGLSTGEPWTTGGGFGVVLLDELHVLADVKVHRFELDSGVDQTSYTTMTVGGEIGWRFFVWKGLHVAPVVRFWPNVWDDAPAGGVALRMRDGSISRHDAEKQGAGGLFANLLVGWAFDL